MRPATIVALMAACVALAIPALGTRSLNQGLDIDFAICRGFAFIDCCQNFDFGNITVIDGKQFPENTECEVPIRANVTVLIREKKFTDHPTLLSDVKAKQLPSRVRTNVTTSADQTWVLHKLKDVNGTNSATWVRKGVFCVCPIA